MNQIQFIFKGFEINQLIYQQGECCIWRAYDLKRQLSVLLKSVKSEAPPVFLLERLRHEFEIANQLDHPNILKYVDLIQHHHRIALVMEDFGGIPMAEAMSEQGFPIAQFLSTALQLTSALIHMHKQHIVHKDFNTQSLFYNPETKEVKVVQFSMASKMTSENPAYLRTLQLGENLPYIAPEQTGRMNRVIDHRSDLYSLGVTLYELLSGQRPFTTQDPLALMHAHMTQSPPLLSKIRGDIPHLFDEFLDKLMAKQAEERYQSAEGLMRDLQECARQWKTDQKFHDFTIASHDQTKTLHIPQKLYGREQEIQSLYSAFDDASDGVTELILVTGHSGMGKTALVNEVRKPLSIHQGYYLRGKFEQHKRNVPFSAIAQILEDLTHQILRDSEAKHRYYREQLLSSLGANAGLLCELVPDLTFLIGFQPINTELANAERKNTFLRLIIQCFKIFAKSTHPLVVFIDDLQWADAASLSLIQQMAQQLHNQHLLLILAYRENDLYKHHPLAEMVKNLHQLTDRLRHIDLKALNKSEISLLLSETLSLPSEDCQSLCDFIYAHTQGNPFYIAELLRSLNQDKQLYFDSKKETWGWKLEVSELNLTSQNLVDVILARMGRLPIESKQLLTMAACFGNEFELQILCKVRQESEEQLRHSLWPAIEAGLISSCSPIEHQLPDNHFFQERYAFQHDRVQQAAYELWPDHQQQANHLRIARILFSELKGQLREEQLFSWVDQYNRSWQLLEDDERLIVSKLNLEAAIKAQRTLSLDSALYYANWGLRVILQEVDIYHLTADHWEQHPALLFDLLCCLAECTGLKSDTEKANLLLDLLDQQAQTLESQIKLVLIRTNIFEFQGLYKKSIDSLLSGLTRLELSLPTSQTTQVQALKRSIKQFPVDLNQLDTENLLSQSAATEPRQQMIMKLLMRLWTPCYITGQLELLSLVSIELAQRTLEYGHTEETPFAYLSFAFVYGRLKEDYCLAYQFGKAGIELADKSPSLTIQGRTSFLYGLVISNWQNPLSQSIYLLERSLNLAKEAGDLVYAGYASFYLMSYGFLSGTPLLELSRNSQHQLAFLEKENSPLLPSALAFSRIFDRLSKEPTTYQFDEKAFLETFQAVPVFMAEYHFSNLCIHFWSDDQQNDLHIANQALSTVPKTLQGTFKVSETWFITSLIYLRHLERQGSQDTNKQVHWHQIINKHIEKLLEYTDNSSSNFLHKYLLLKAELSRISGDPLSAMELYESAIDAAAQGGFIQTEALGNEYFGHFWMTRKHPKIALLHLKRAHYLYRFWGNKIKADNLSIRYPEFENELVTSAESNQESYSLPRFNRAATLGQQPEKSHSPLSLDANLDTRSALKASLAIMNNIQSENISMALLKVMVESAGADRGLLLLKNDEGDFLLEAQMATDPLPEEYAQDYSKPLVRFVKSTRSSLVVAEAHLEKNYFDPHYLKYHPVKSALCIPLVDTGQSLGVIYFENYHFTDAFPTSRQEFLELLSAQVVTALRNARLYDELKSSEQRFRDLVEGSVQGIVIHNELKPLFINKTFAAMTGYSEYELMRMKTLEPLVLKEERRKILHLQSLFKNAQTLPPHFDIKIVARDGSRLVLDNMSRMITWEGQTAIQSTLVDITDRRRYERQIEHMASHDALSKLPNRMLFQDRLQHALSNIDKQKQCKIAGAVMMLDLNRFKEINDSLGHSMGDELIKGVSRRLLSQIKDTDTVARLGGDEFAILLEGIDSTDDVATAAQRITDALGKPFTFDDHELFTSVSIGISLYPNDSLESEELIRFADMAMYSAKNNTESSFQFFQQQMNINLRKQKEMAVEIREALKNDAFYMVYQPQINAKTLHTTGFEALLRWEHNGKLIPTDIFLNVAEQNGLITDIGHWVLHHACNNAVNWLTSNKIEQANKPILAINVSAPQFHQTDLVSTIKHVLAESGLPPQQLEIEITESLLMKSIDTAVSTMEALNKLGVRLSIDDFGTGYSSLSYLQQFPVQTIKIDRSFINEMAFNEDSAAITRAIIELGHVLNMRVVAEGVEDEEQLHLLQTMGCDIIQGYYFSRPLPSNEVEEWLLKVIKS